MADSVEKVLSGVGTNFLRTAGALGVLGRGGPLRLERIDSVAFPHNLRGQRQPKSAAHFCANLLTRHLRLFRHNRPLPDSRAVLIRSARRPR